MNVYSVQLVGQPPIVQEIEAYSPHHAVQLAAGCAAEEVCLPIWRAGPCFDGTWQRECYMPLDNSGRQWIVSGGHE